MKSAFLKLSQSDLVKGAITAGIAVIGAVLLPALNAGKLPTFADLQQAGIMGLTAGLAYLLKNFLTNSKDEFAKPEVK